MTAYLLLACLLASPASATTPPCSVHTGSANARYRVVLLVDRSGSMQRHAAGIKTARANADNLLARLATYGEGLVSVTLATFGSGVGEVWPAPGSSGSPAEARAVLDRFFPTDPRAYNARETCVYRSIFELAGGELGLTDPSEDLGATAPWDFLVFTDGEDTCSMASGPQRAWLERNRAALRHRIWPVADGVGPPVAEGTEYLYTWNAPLQGTVNLSTGVPDQIEIPDPAVVTLIPRLLADPAAATCHALAEAPERPPVVPFAFVGEDGATTDEPGWSLVREAHGDGPFQARWSPGAVRLPGTVAEGRYTLRPSEAVVCTALGALHPGAAFSPLSTSPGCAAATVDVVRRPVVALSAEEGAVDAALDVGPPGWFGGYDPLRRSLVLTSAGGVEATPVHLAIESTGLAVPDDIELCVDGHCAGEVDVAVAAGAPARVVLGAHARPAPWAPLAWLAGRAGATPGAHDVRLCARADGASVSCPDCSAPPVGDCVTIAASVPALGLHLYSVLTGLLLVAGAVYVGTTPRFHPGLKGGADPLRGLHGRWRALFRRPLHVVNEGGRLRVRATAAGAVAELRPVWGKSAQVSLRALQPGWSVGPRNALVVGKPMPRTLHRRGEHFELSGPAGTVVFQLD